MAADSGDAANPPVRTVEIAKWDAVGWFNIPFLVKTGQRALVSALVGERSGRREILAALDQRRPDGPRDVVSYEDGYFDHRGAVQSDSDELWIDYVADLGDGFNATHSIAWLVGRDQIFVGGPGEAVGQPIPDGHDREVPADFLGPSRAALPAGRILVFGGDQTYPYASQENYQGRTHDPYFAARPWESPGAGTSGRRFVYSIPGNHDWYDGLSAYIRMFCQPGRWMGCWQVQQRRSYFSLRLPHGFWIWGIDTATEDDIDPPQMAYFEHQATLLSPEDRVVLCVPTPSWTECDGSQRVYSTWDSWNKLKKIISLVADRPGMGHANVPLVLSGDLHHYAHHVEDSDGPRHYVVCGGGGAFMLGTEMTPPTLRFPDGERARLLATFPTPRDTRTMRRGVFRLVSLHKVFCATLASALLGLVWLIVTAARRLHVLPPPATSAPPPDATGRAVDAIAETIRDVIPVLLQSPGTLIAVAATAWLFVALALSGSPRGALRWRAVLAGLVHLGVQLAAASALVALATIAVAWSGLGFVTGVLAAVVVLVPVGTVIHGFLFAAYIRLANGVAHLHEQEIYSAQAIQDWKCFLRMRLTKDGLTIYPIGLRKVERVWETTLQVTRTSATRLLRSLLRLGRVQSEELVIRVPEGTTHLFRPAAELRPELIETPFRIAAARRTVG